MKSSKILLLSIFAALFLFVACDDDEITSVVESKVLVEYLENQAEPAVNTFPKMIKSSSVNTAIVAQSTDQYIIDIRSATDYDAGHIAGAVNVSAGSVLAHYEEKNLETYGTVVIVCYTGQTAGWVNGLLRTVGIDNTYDLKWGMSSWNATLDKWSSNIGDSYIASLTTDATDKADEGKLPTISTGKILATDILRSRVETVFAEGFGEAAVTASDVFTTPNDYYIVNYWPADHYNWNHIPGAIQYNTPADGGSFTSDTFLKTLPTDETIAVYCYTGQTSAHVAAYLRVLGYDAKSIKFGMNGMNHTDMPGTRFVADTEVHDYELVPTATK